MNYSCAWKRKRRKSWEKRISKTMSDLNELKILSDSRFWTESSKIKNELMPFKLRKTKWRCSGSKQNKTQINRRQLSWKSLKRWKRREGSLLQIWVVWTWAPQSQSVETITHLRWIKLRLVLFKNSRSRHNDTVPKQWPSRLYPLQLWYSQFQKNPPLKCKSLHLLLSCIQNPLFRLSQTFLAQTSPTALRVQSSSN